MRIAIGSDHAGYPVKEELVAHLKWLGHQVDDLGAHHFDPEDDYPDFAKSVAQAIASGQAERGVMVCGSGVGASVAANKVTNVRAAMCHDTYSAHQGVEHDDMNVLCLGARVIGIELARELVGIFLEARFTGEDRHKRRLAKINKMENEMGVGNIQDFDSSVSDQVTP
ncbi:ribose 5-phosphate isomerase B [Dehalococcoidia bacterium]|nr:ribose 5-phosphate isomerase B [Dehalococcoidia bacterium]